ncbi:MAG: hypothetical protein GF404_09545 [candidate division Zixibacteria bacterium]|nr:hypothetical protein [candidate division Zixibacteria bacterium]
MSANLFTVSYMIDHNNCIIDVDQNWDSFAEKNCGMNLLKQEVIGKPLLHYISDSSTRHIYEMLILKARKHDRQIEFDFRCDSPGLRRYMRMQMVPEKDEMIRFDSSIVRTQERTPLKVLEMSLPRTDQMIVMCGWCKDIRDNGHWFSLEEAVERFDLLKQDELPQISHSICEKCLEKMEQEAA